MAVATAAGCTLPGTPTGPTPAPKKTTRPAVAPTTGASVAPLKPGILNADSPISAGAPRVVPQAGAIATLTGKVKLISDRGGSLVANNSAAVISNNTGSLISDRGGALVSDRGGALVSNNSAGLTAKTKFQLQQAAAAPAPAAEALLADAIVTVHDAQGRMLVDEAGKPLKATTNADGSYTLAASLPAENLILRVRLWQGGELSAMVTKDWPALQAMIGASEPLPLDVDTASTLGAAYVLTRFVKGDQAIYDKLPAVEARRLKERMGAAQNLVAGVPSYQPSELVDLAETLRQGAEGVDEALEDIETLLLGQAELGEGRAATEVALLDPRTIVQLPNGEWLVGEESIGRIRRIDKAGKITTWADQVQGLVKKNFYGLTALRAAKDGSVLVVAASEKRAYRIGADNLPKPLPLPADFAAWSLAEGPDGTVYVGEGNPTGRVGQVLAIAPDGTSRAVAPAGWGGGGPTALSCAPDGTLYALVRGFGSGTVWKLAPGAAAWDLFVDAFLIGGNADLLAMKDGSLYVANDLAARVWRHGPDKVKTTVVGGEGAPGEGQLRRPAGMSLDADGTLLLADPGAAVVWRVPASGPLVSVAGVGAGGAAQIGDGSELAINTPGGVAFDGQGRMVFSETAGHAVKRYDGKTLATIAGDGQGRAGDGGPAVKAQLNSPTAVVTHGDQVWVIDSGNRSIRRIEADGTIQTQVGADHATQGFLPFGPSFLIPAGRCKVFRAAGLTLDPAGLPVWTSADGNQVVRLQADGQARMIAGQADETAAEGADGPTAAGTALAAPFGIAYGPDGALYFSDGGNMRVRRMAKPDDPAGGIETWLGTGAAATIAKLKAGEPTLAADATRQTASIVAPGGLCFDKAGNMYVGELGTRQLLLVGRFAPPLARLELGDAAPVPARILKVTPAGAVSIVAGPGGKFFTDPEAADALVLPSNLTIDPKGRLVVLDAGANLIRFLPAGSF